MPFYEYQCQACGEQTEVLQKITDAPLKKCPSCGKSQLKKLISAPVFRLKGAGWYETDFKTDKDAKRNLAGDDAPPAAAADKTEAPAKESAPAKPEPAAKPVKAKARPTAKGKVGTAKAKPKAKGRR